MRILTKTPKKTRELTPYEKVLFGDEVSSSLIEAHAIIIAHRPSSNEDLLEQIKHNPFISPEWPSFILILEAIFAQRGKFNCQQISYFLLKYCKEENYVPKHPVNLIIGLVSGLQKNGPSEGLGCGLGHLSDILQFFMTGEFSFNEFSSVSATKSKGQLSETLSAFLGEKSPDIGRRLVCVTNAITAVKEELDSGKKLSPFGEVLMEELCRKVFGRMSINGKMDAVTLTIEEMMKSATPVVVAS